MNLAHEFEVGSGTVESPHLVGGLRSGRRGYRTGRHAVSPFATGVLPAEPPVPDPVSLELSERHATIIDPIQPELE